MIGTGWSRRGALRSLGALTAGAWVRSELHAQGSPLPLRTSGLEHLGVTVPDQEASAKFYGRIFDPQLFQEKDPPPRFYARMGMSYIAFGGINANATNTMPRIDHFCALVTDYKPAEMRAALEQAGLPIGPVGMIPDPDGLRLQLLGAPGGLAKTIIPNTRISQEPPAVQAIGFDHIVLAVSDLEKSVGYYRKFFGMESSRVAKPARVWFQVAGTKLGLEPAGSGRMPCVDRFSVRVAGFNRREATDRLKKLGVEVVPSEDHTVRFRDPNGFTVELIAGA